MDIQHLNFLSLQLTAMKEHISERIFENAQKAIKESSEMLNDMPTNIAHKNTLSENAVFHSGKTIEEILHTICIKYIKKDIPAKDSIGSVIGDINKSSKNGVYIIPKHIQNTMTLLYNYRNNAAHSSKRLFTSDEVLFSIQGMIVVLEWYINSILKKKIKFSDLPKQKKLKEYKALFEMALIDNKIHHKEREFLKQIADDFNIPEKETQKIEYEVLKEKPQIRRKLFEQKVYYENIYPAIEALKDIIKNERIKNERINIKNIALDMAVAWPLYHDIIMKKYSNITISSLIMSPNIKNIKTEWKNNIKTQINNYKLFLKENENGINSEQNIKIKINENLPIMHGFLINNKYLLWSFLGCEHKLLTGGDQFYHYNTPENDLGRYYINIFQNWFDLWWDEGISINIDS